MIWLLALACGKDDTVVDSAPFVYDPLVRAGCTSTAAEDEHRDGDVDQIEVSTWGPHAGELTRETDEDADGAADQRRAWTYDADDQPIREDIDEDADGAVDVVTTWRWEGGLLVYEGFDRDNDGVDDLTETYAYDGAQLIRTERDPDGDGRVDEVCEFSWSETDEHGASWLRAGSCAAGSRTLNTSEVWVGEGGAFLRSVVDINNGDLIDTRTWAYNDWSLLTGSDFERVRPDGVEEAWTTQTWYDPVGLPVAEEQHTTRRRATDVDERVETAWGWVCE
ncbi:MAG: hypothetical protein H6739_36820 [Alphaproteobacteria bacterium]|nr:hypothetical protein [Alphaproteobacteria bacterium]